MLYKEIFIAYLDAYAEKNLQKVSEMFADTIVLRDWKISVSGKEAATAETRKNFQAVDSIDIEVLNLYESSDGIAGELKIMIDKSETIFVVDVLSYDELGKIKSIHAYIGRDD
jgi:hypothetical protein